jgi:hypothetical protein
MGMTDYFPITPKVFLAIACVGITPLAAAAEDGKTVRSFYFGNSLTAGTAPELHGKLAAGRGDAWRAEMFGIAGGRLQQYVDLIFPNYPDMAYPNPDEGKAQRNALRARKAIETEAWDAVVIQPHQFHLRQYANWLKREAGDIFEGGKLVEWIREHQPQAQIYLYQTWTVPAYFDNDQEKPDWSTFDYERFWLRPYSNPAPEDDPSPSRVMRTQDYHRKLLKALNTNHVDILRNQPILVIPVGDAMLELDRRLKAGEFADADGKPFVVTRRTVIVDNETDKTMVDIKAERIPLTDIRLFYQDFQHQNPGLPRFFDAAVFYATLFGEKPLNLDYSGYNVFPSKREDGSFDTESYVNWRANDNRKFIEITPEQAQAVAELIWEVVSRHPNTGMKP